MPYRVAAIASVFLWGLIHFAAASPFQARIVEKARSPNLASVLNQSAFNFGNALGASMGGLALTHGLRYAQLPYVSAGVAVLALAAGVVAWRTEAAQAVAV